MMEDTIKISLITIMKDLPARRVEDALSHMSTRSTTKMIIINSRIQSWPLS